jgi:very-short-patch-repair endonuclease
MNIHAIWRDVERLARQQYGVVHRDQLLKLGVTRAMIGHRVRTKEWLRLAPCVYALASHPATWQRQYKAAELATPDSSVAGLSAGHVLGWDGFRTTRPEVVSHHTSNHRNQLAVVHRGCDVKVTTVRGIRVTTHAQTLCDLLPRLRLDRWEQVADHLLLSGQMTIAELDERRVAYELSRRPGLPLLRALVAERLAERWLAPESELETLLRSAVALVPGCPPVRWQAPTPWDDSKRVDGLIDAWGLILEADGRAWHARVRDFDKDRWRDNQAAAHGLRVQRFTHAHLNYRRDEVVEIITQAGRATNAA